ncbi:MAG: hypothetical protein HC771_13615 [Synechococcales cyanobacterium CRU_2_2]|nr:hypothetical protein [Synechococcales cyanobacterium CRU_2_2]
MIRCGASDPRADGGIKPWIKPWIERRGRANRIGAGVVLHGEGIVAARALNWQQRSLKIFHLNLYTIATQTEAVAGLWGLLMGLACGI